jgi:Ca2+/Na+ antiporter
MDLSHDRCTCGFEISGCHSQQLGGSTHTFDLAMNNVVHRLGVCLPMQSVNAVSSIFRTDSARVSQVIRAVVVGEASAVYCLRTGMMAMISPRVLQSCSATVLSRCGVAVYPCAIQLRESSRVSGMVFLSVCNSEH